MKNKLLYLLLLLLMMGCRQEDLFEKTRSPENFKVYTINKEAILKDFMLFDKVATIQNRFEEGNKLSRMMQDSLLHGGIIGINKVLVVEDNNGQKTYTFPVKRNFVTNKIENLVLKRNADSTFSGVLMQYDLSPYDRVMFNDWHSIDLQSKTRIYDIDNISIDIKARETSAYFGCFYVAYEDGMCASDSHAYGDNSCDYIKNNQPDKQAKPPRVLSITAIPGCGGGGDSGGGSSTPPASSYDPSGGGSYTMLFEDYDLTYHDGDMTSDSFKFWQQVTQFVQSQPQIVKNLNAEYHYVFYFIHTYFSVNGGYSSAGLPASQKSFVSQRLLQIAQWYYDPMTGNHLDYEQKKSIAIWSVRYLLENQDITWEEYVNSFLKSQCEKTNALLQKPEVQAGINELKTKSKQKDEFGFTIDDNGNPTALVPGDENHVDLGNNTGFPKHYHVHPPKKIKMLSVKDMLDLLTLALYQQPTGNQNNASSGMIGSTICSACPDGYYYFHYIATFSGNPAELNQLVNGTNWDEGKLITDYQRMYSKIRKEDQYTDYNLETVNYKGLEKLFFETLKNMGLENKVSLQRVDNDGTVNNINLDTNNEPNATPCL